MTTIPWDWRQEDGVWADEPDTSHLPTWTTFRYCPDESRRHRQFYENSRYWVTRQQIRPGLYRLGIQNRDQSARHDWRDFQRIKNEIVGLEAEAIELYPAESRKLDPSNFFILWVSEDGDFQNIGYRHGREVYGPDESIAPQRSFEQ